jgi:hypothetical protein
MLGDGKTASGVQTQYYWSVDVTFSGRDAHGGSVLKTGSALIRRGASRWVPQ